MSASVCRTSLRRSYSAVRPFAAKTEPSHAVGLPEEHDVAADHPDVVARMWEFIRASHTEPENPLFKMEIPEV